MLLEDMLVIDAATIYPRYTRGGSLYSLDIIDGATIKPLIGEDGRSPEPPDPAYQQILHGVPAADFSADELLYLPRNMRAHRLYGMSPVEQIALTVNIALRRDAATLDYYRTGSSPDAFATLPKEWTADQIRQFQDYFDALMSGNLARRRMTKFMPADFKLIEARQPPLKDMYDEWLARIICYAFSVPASPFVSQVNRATSETLRLQATQEGLVPLKAWIKNALDHVIQSCMNEPGLEFVWVGDDAIDPLQQAQTLNILVSVGIKTREEARAELGLGAGGKTGAPTALGKFNPHHDEQGRFSTADNAVAVVGTPTRKSKPSGVQVASNDAMMSDVADDASSRAIEVAQIGNLLHPLSRGHPVCRKGLARRKAHRPRHPRSRPKRRMQKPHRRGQPLALTHRMRHDQAPPKILRATWIRQTRIKTTNLSSRSHALLANATLLYILNFMDKILARPRRLNTKVKLLLSLTAQGNPDILQVTRAGGNIVRFQPNDG